MVEPVVYYVDGYNLLSSSNIFFIIGGLIVLATAFTALNTIGTTIMLGRDKTINYISKKVIDSDAFKEMNRKQEEMAKNITALNDGHQKQMRMILRNSLNKMYYDLMAMDKIKDDEGMYGDYMEMYAEYTSYGGNGRVDSQKTKLQQKYLNS